MKALLAIFLTVYAITFVATPKLGAGWFWDIGNGIGFAAFSGLLYLVVTSGRPFDVQRHQHLAFAVLFIALGHTFWFLLGDAAAVELIKPGAPDYMWLGLISLVLLLALITVALPTDRRRLHRDHASFRHWHRFLSIATIAAATYHIVISGFYLGSGYQVAMLICLVSLVCFGRSIWTKLAPVALASTTVLLAFSTAMALLFAALRNLPT